MYFDEKKSTALAVSFLNKSNGKTMEYMKLIKLMYIADRMMIENNEAPITQDNYVAMKNGMVLSNVYNLIKQNDAENGIAEIDSTNFWHKHIQTMKKNFTVKILSDLTDKLLNDIENSTVDEIWKQYGTKSQWEMVDILHDSEKFPEWSDPYPYGVQNISIYEILEVMNKSSEDRSTILDKIEGI